MPPPPSQKPGQASISAFFKPKSSQRPITKSCQPDRAQVSNGYARTSNLLDTDTGASSLAQPPHKRSKLNNKDGPRRETIDRMSKWKFTALQPSDNVYSLPAIVHHESAITNNSRFTIVNAAGRGTRRWMVRWHRFVREEADQHASNRDKLIVNVSQRCTSRSSNN